MPEDIKKKAGSAIQPEKSAMVAKKVKKHMREAAKLAREGLRIYSDLRGRKGFVQYGLGALSLWGEVDRMLQSNNKVSEQKYLVDKGLRKCLGGMGGTVKDILDHSGIAEEKICIGESSSEYILAYRILDTEIFMYRGSYNSKEIYCRCEEDAIKAISYLVRKNYKNNISVSIGDGDSYSRSFIKLSSIDIGFEFYNPTIDMDEFIDRLNKYQRGFGINRSAIFYGPPGTGKTTFAVALAERMGGNLLVLSPQAITRMAHSDTPIDTLISITNPTVLLLDDIDKANGLEKLLVDIEKLNRQVRSNKNLIIASANDLAKIPTPMKRPGRFDELIKFDLPDKNKRKGLLVGYMKHFDIVKDDAYVDKLAEITKGFAPAYLREIALESSFHGIEDMTQRVAQIKMMLQIAVEEEKKVGEKKDTSQTKAEIEIN